VLSVSDVADASVRGDNLASDKEEFAQAKQVCDVFTIFANNCAAQLDWAVAAG